MTLSIELLLQHYTIMLSVNMLSVVFNLLYDTCRYAECRGAISNSFSFHDSIKSSYILDIISLNFVTLLNLENDSSI